MRLKQLTAALSFFISAISSAQGKFTLCGSINENNVSITLLYLDSAGSDKTIFSKRGKFKFRGIINQEYECVSLLFKKGNKYLGKQSFLITNKKADIKFIKGENQALYISNHVEIPFIAEKRKFDSLLSHFKENQLFIGSINSNNKISKKGNEDSLINILSKINDKLLSEKISFFLSDTTSYFNIYFFNKEVVNNINANIRLSPDSLLNLYFRFSKALQNSKIGQITKLDIDKRVSLSLGKPMQMFSFSDSGFNKYDLGNLIIKKYILLCFWDAGCKPCIASFPFLKSIYEKYKDSLEIISISLDVNEMKWKQSLNKYELPWINTCNIEKYRSSNLSTIYNVQFIPQYFLLDKTGYLIYHNVQSGDTEEYFVLKNLITKLFTQEIKTY